MRRRPRPGLRGSWRLIVRWRPRLYALRRRSAEVARPAGAGSTAGPCRPRATVDRGSIVRTFLSAIGALILTLPATDAGAQLRFELVARGRANTVAFVEDPVQPATFLLVSQDGVVDVLTAGAIRDTPFLDLRGSISSGGERGLLGLAFPPDAADSGRVFVNFTNPAGHTRDRPLRASRRRPVHGRAGIAQGSSSGATAAPSSSSRSRTTTAATSRSVPTAVSTSAWATAGRATTRRTGRRR